MGVGINLLQLFERGVCANLRCGERHMAEQLLHTLYVSPIVEHCRRERVAQHMRRFFLHRSDKCEFAAHGALHILATYASAPHGEE